jgi:outer membrane protein OmpA-like peptidoglycan-associated protein
MFFKCVLLCLLGMLVGCESATVRYTSMHVAEVSEPGSPDDGESQISSTDSDRSGEPLLMSISYQERTPQEQSLVVDPFPTVFFPFDSWNIDADVRKRLDATAGWMNRFPRYGLMVEGHTDVRGTESYNMVLGEKRAHAVKEYLGKMGVSLKRIETLSYGKTFVFCEVDDESNCHQFNRRAELFLE